MQKEVENYKDLVDIQGKYIPKLICYGYYGGGMSFIIGMTIVGTTLSIKEIGKGGFSTIYSAIWKDGPLVYDADKKYILIGIQIETKALKGLEAIHKHGIFHNDIREENILINDNDDIYLIDFGMASQEDTKKKRKLFDEEQLKYSNLLDKYKASHIVKNAGRISKSRKCQIVS
ncbi:unnamed protein product [Rhizophagus irregularis]|nr:unnamed protein product [Rhizophagus irregularis]